MAFAVLPCSLPKYLFTFRLVTLAAYRGSSITLAIPCPLIQVCHFRGSFRQQESKQLGFFEAPLPSCLLYLLQQETCLCCNSTILGVRSDRLFHLARLFLICLAGQVAVRLLFLTEALRACPQGQSSTHPAC